MHKRFPKFMNGIYDDAEFLLASENPSKDVILNRLQNRCDVLSAEMMIERLGLKSKKDTN
jgi:hypothetical protein